jgi:hypothetical protein
MSVALAMLALSACAGPASDAAPKSSVGTKMNLSQTIGAVLQQAEQAIQSQDWARANTLLKQGLDQLGSQYVMPNTLDETGLKLQLAAVEESRGNHQVAANLRRRVLESRLTLYRQKSGNGP